MSPVIEKLPILILYPHSRCNCRCVMCDIWKSAECAEISAAELERHAADIAALGVEWVIFSGGEPLMHSDLFRLCGVLRALGLRLTILSTGLLLGRYAERIVRHVDEVIVSLDGPREIHDQIRRVPGAFDSLSAGVRALHELEPKFPVAGRCTVQKQNCSRLADTVAAAKQIGLRSISFLAADVSSTAFNRPEPWGVDRQAEVALGFEDLGALEREVAAIIESRDGFIRETPEKLDRIVGHFRAHLGLEKYCAPLCNAPWVSAVIESDGTVRPCFFHAPVGNIREGGLRDVVNGPRAVAFRESLVVSENPVCRRCVCSLHLRRGSEGNGSAGV